MATPMATREAPDISPTSRIGRGRICNSPSNTPDTHASMAAQPTTMARVAMRAATTRFTWMRNSCSDTHLGNYNYKSKGEKRNEKQGIHLGGTDGRVVHRSVGRRYRRKSYWHERPVGSLRRHDCGQNVSRTQRAPGHGSKGTGLCAAHYGRTTGHNG